MSGDWVGAIPRWVQLEGDVVHDDRTPLNTVFKYTNVWIIAFIPSAIVFMCSSHFRWRMYRFTSNLLLPYSDSIIFMQMPMLNYCSCFCCLQANSCYPGITQGGPRKVLFFSKQPYSNHYLLGCGLLLNVSPGGSVPFHAYSLKKIKPECKKIRGKKKCMSLDPSWVMWI